MQRQAKHQATVARIDTRTPGTVANETVFLRL